ncbi:uncharacterized protein LOC134815164 [Bolinopsis microptera]|uniref:uncharacterized protein LOC134815164 n=1 Tax=Bolinopsis microptera TaxID=2820187 RepID=UPI00307A3D8B
MATRNTAKYGSELARLLNALAGSSDNIVNTQDTLTDILDKVADLHPKQNSIALCQFYEDCGHEPIISILPVLLNNKECNKEFFIATIRALRNVNGLRKLRTDHWQSLPYQETMLLLLTEGLRSDDELKQLYSAATLAGVTMHYSEFTKNDIPDLLMKMYSSDDIQEKIHMATAADADYLHPTTTRASAAHTIMKFYQSKVFYERIVELGFIRRTMEIVAKYEQYETDLLFCLIRYFLFSCLIHSRPEMKTTEKQLEVDFFSKVLPDISESFECMNPTMQEIVRSSCKVVSTQALQYGHMLTPEAGATQWMEEHEEEACGLLRKPLDIKRKCSKTDCKNIENEVGEFDRCSACKVTVYCSPTCQKEHWTEKHKKLCKRLRKCYQVKVVEEVDDLD